MHFIDDVRSAFLDEDSVGPEAGVTISFSSGRLKMCRKPRNLAIFHMSCLCLKHIVLDSLEVKFRLSPELVVVLTHRSRLGWRRVL